MEKGEIAGLKKIVLQTCVNEGLFRKGLNGGEMFMIFTFYMSAVHIFWKKTGGKEKLLVTSNFPFSHSVFYSFEEFSAIFINFEIVICKLFQFESLKFVVWERAMNEVV